MQPARLIPRTWMFFAAIVAAALMVVVGPSLDVAAHAEVERSSPAENALLGAPPRSIELWSTERIAADSGSPSIRVLDQEGDGQGITIANVRIDPNDPRHVLADVDGIGAGTYTIVWTLLSADDGHILSGSIPFRVAGTRGAPGAASVEGESPRVWAVATRWLTFLGAAIAAAGFLYGLIIEPDDVSPAARRRRRVSIVAAGAVALIATIAEPFLQTRFPAEGAAKPSIGDAISGLPNAWWLRPAALVVVIALAALLFILDRRTTLPPIVPMIGAAASLVALLGLALTSHASARETWRVAAVPSIVIHQWAVGLWVGGLAQLALSWPWGRGSSTGESNPPGGPDPVRQFSRYALVLAAVGIGTGVLNAGLILPTLRSLWQSDYGDFLIAKVAILLPVLGLASFHRLSLRRFAVEVGARLRTTVRLEAALVLLVVLGGSILALMAPPIAARGSLKTIDLAAPAVGVAGADDLLVRLQITPAKPGDNRLNVIVARADGTLIPTDQIALIRLSLTSIDFGAVQPDIPTTPTAAGGFATETLKIGLEAWWRVDVLIRRLGVEDATVPFYVRLPDPNINGFEDDEPSGSADARAVFERGLAGVVSLHSVHWSQRLATGTGVVQNSDLMVRDGSDGQPIASAALSTEYRPAEQQQSQTSNNGGTPETMPATAEQIVIGSRRWFRQNGGEWSTGESGPPSLPSDWGSAYDDATGFHLGGTETVNGEQAQIVTFYVPQSRYAAAYYAWWVGTESGHVLRETMVSTYHYMLYEYRDFDQPLPIEAPVST